jgi:hypothetical protein
MADARAASRIEAFEVTAPKGTPKTAPIEVSTKFNPAELVRVEVIVPDGVTYLAGLRILLAHAQAIPSTAGSWIVANDEKIELETMGYSNSGAWSVLVYNTDIFDHTFHVRFHVADFPLTQPPPEAAPIATPLVV